MEALAVAIIVVAALVGTVLAVVTLPGVWLMLGVALACDLWQPTLLSTPTLLAGLGLALAGEAIEFAASSLGARRAGASRAGAIGAAVGSLVGAVAGLVIPPPIIGSIVAGVVGAGVGAVVAERRWGGKGWSAAATVGTGAALGRMVATVAKAAVAAMVGVILVAAALL